MNSLGPINESVFFIYLIAEYANYYSTEFSSNTIFPKVLSKIYLDDYFTIAMAEPTNSIADFAIFIFLS